MPHFDNPTPDPAQHAAQPGLATSGNPPVGSLAGSGSIPRSVDNSGTGTKSSRGFDAAATPLHTEENHARSARGSAGRPTGRGLLKTPDVCRRLGVSRKTFWRWRRAGLFPAGIRLAPGGIPRWEPGVVEAWIAGHEAAAEASRKYAQENWLAAHEAKVRANTFRKAFRR